jgi:hypothetical protein
MTTLLVIYDIDGWAYHFRAKAIYLKRAILGAARSSGVRPAIIA